MDLKCNLMDLNLELGKYLITNERFTYNKPTAFIFSEDSSEWNMVKSGLGKILVHPLFYHQICPHIINSMLALNEVFKNQNYDAELINIYQEFRNKLYQISRKLIALDDEEEAKGICYLTFEQLINEITFTYFHLYCLYFDLENYCLSETIKEEYNQSFDQLKFFQERSKGIEWMLLEANEVAEVKISYSLLNLLEEDNSFSLSIETLNNQFAKAG